MKDVPALPRASFASFSPARWPQRPPSLFGHAVCGFFSSKNHDAAASEPLWVLTHKGQFNTIGLIKNRMGIFIRIHVLG